MKRISVCLATYNGEKYISEQLQSILKQLSDQDEVVISDDQSSDGTLDIVRSFNDRRIEIYQTSRIGHIRNFDNALSKAAGEYIFMADQDDIWMDNKVEVMMKYLETNELVASDCILVDKELNILKPSFFESSPPKVGLVSNFIKNNYVGCCMAFRGSLLKYVLPIPHKIKSHDTWVGLVAEMYGKPVFIKDRLIFFRRHGANFSASVANDTFLSGKSPFKWYQIIANRFWLAMSLLKRYLQIRK